MNNDDQTAKNVNVKQIKLIQNLPTIHTGQYLALSDGESLKIVQVQESNVADQNLLVQVDIENVVLNLSDNYDLLQSLVTTASSQQIDLSQLIINELTNYPQLQDQLAAANKSLADAQSKIAELQSDNQELQDEINKLNEKKQEATPTNPSTTDPSKNTGSSSTTNQPTSSDSSKNDTQTGISNTNDQVQAGSDKTSEKASDEVSDQNKTVGANNEQ